MTRRDRNIRTPVTDGELAQATDVIERWYREWARSTANDLVLDFMRGEIENIENFSDRLHEVTDSAMTYNIDQSRTLFASNSVDEAMQEVEGMGGGGENAQAVLAVTTFQIDVREALWDEFREVEDLDPYERLKWLAEEKGTLITTLGTHTEGENPGAELFYVGEVDDIDFGVVLLNHEEETGVLESLRGVIRGKDREVAALVAGYVQEHGSPEMQVDVDQWLSER